ncbi:MAG: Ig-like domain-containing protein, partial [Bacteroidaceae bacterium]|nr:Ig-like domain-containing protein [Bacteroidaceae bacterium]
MKHLYITFLLLLFSLGIVAQTQTVPVRYVLTTGKFTNDGRSWATAKDNVQDAINDVKDYMTRNNLKEGRVYVGAGVYTPTESTESGTGGVLTTSFKIPEGVSVYGGFAPNGKIYQPTGSAATKTTGKTVGSPQESPDDRLMRNGLTQAENEQLGGDHRTSSERVRAWDFDTQSQTYLSGNHADKAQITGYLDWKSTNKQYAEAFPGNSYHVVWFGTNGEIADSDPLKQQHYAPLKEPALLDGFVISGGSASTKAIDRRYHTSYGGGVYMVKGAAVRNCRITENAAARCGGAVYLDGGGELTNCYVFKNQAKGIGLTDGYGGGVFVEQEGTVRNCMLIENAASIGAGMMLNHDRTRYPQSNTGEAYFSNAFAPIAVGCVIVNNTATTEAGGIAMVSGGTANHLTVVRNHCAGNSVTINKRRYGRAGGLYIDIGAAVFNSVVWGNTNNTNSKTQYAAYAPTTSTAGEGVKPYLNFTAVANYDQTEWTGTSKIGVIGLNTENNRTASSNTAKDYYPEFAKVSDLVNGIAGIDGKGSEYNTEYVPTQISDLVGKGVALRDYITERSKEMINAVSDYDIYGNHLAPISTLGACLSKSVIEHITPAGDVANIENDGKTVKTIFVDPNFKAGADIAADNRGSSWDNPLVYLGDALHYIDDYLKDHSGEVFQVLVKEGTLSAANRQANSHHSESDQLRLRDLSLTVNTGVRIYGSFYSNLTGKNIKVSSKFARSPLLTPTYITGDITGLGYDDNVAHVVTLNGAVESVVDGFNIQGGNTTAAPQLNQPWKPNDANGAGIYISGGNGNKVRNCVISNCTTDKGQGSAVYANGSANLTFENIIINNNAASPANSTDKPAAAMLTGGTGATFNHCLFRGNVGALTSDGGSTVTVKNTAFHANGTQALDGKNIEGGELAKGTIADKLLAVLATNSGSFGSCAANLIDDDLINQVSISGFSAILSHDPQSNANYLYPKFANPTTSVGVNQGGLVTYYGGNADFTPDNMNPMVNAANDADINSLFDITTTTPRSYGGAPDIGPIEDTHLPEMGTILYVQPSGSDSSNGLSWGNSFATVSKALTTASSSGGTVKEIWVAEGTYISNPTGDVHSQKYAYQMIQGVNVYGGFPATGTPGMNERNPKTHETILKAGVTSPEQMAASESTSYGRVLVQPSSFTTETVWNGFTITYGYLLSCYRQDIGGKLQTLNTENVGTTGGAGVYLMSGGVLENCRIKDNWVLVIPNKTGMTQTGSSGGGFHQAGAGIYNAGGTIRNCVIEGNVLQHNLVKSGSNYESAWLYGAGLFQDKGNVYNTIICKNEGRVKGTTTNFHQVVAGAGACLVEGQFYNNTIAGNKSTAQNCTSSGRTKILASGVYIFRKLDMYNCVIANNTEESPDYSGEIKKVPLLAVKDGTTKDVDASKINAHFCDIYKPDNTYNIYVSSSSSNNITSNPNLDASYRLQSGSPCINAGTENITGVTIPEQDADYTDRIKDCHIDIGAYEYNGASEIAYKEVTEDSKKKHVYFVTQNGKGFASAANPEDAACAQKLQLVLDAAGRHKYDLMNDGDTSNDNIEIVVRLAAFGIRNGATGYAPTHEVRYGENGQALRQYENPLAYSLVVPRGVVLEGGWCNAGKYEEPTVVVNSIRLNKTTLDLSKGGSETLAASLTPATASETETVTWSSSNPSVVTVAGGKVTAVGAGTATVSATCQGKTATCYVTVNSHITGITLNPSPAAVKPGGTVTIKATLVPADHTDDPTITWKSNNTAVATVSADGVVTGIAEGEATIIATTSNGISATCVVKVSNFTITESSIDLSIVNNVSQGTQTLKTVGASGTVTWSSDATGVATVSNSGVVTPVGFGVATITATNSGQTATCKVYVSETVNGVLMYN